MPNIPHHTGKVAIGIYHERRQNFLPSKDMELVQTALIGGRYRASMADIADLVVASAIGLLLAWFLVAWWSS